MSRPERMSREAEEYLKTRTMKAHAKQRKKIANLAGTVRMAQLSTGMLSNPPRFDFRCGAAFCAASAFAHVVMGRR